MKLFPTGNNDDAFTFQKILQRVSIVDEYGQWVITIIISVSKRINIDTSLKEPLQSWL